MALYVWALLSCAPASRADQAAASVRLSAINFINGEHKVGLVETASNETAYLGAGEDFKGLIIEAIDPDKEQITARVDGSLRIISLRGDPEGRIIPLPAIPTGSPDYVPHFKPTDSFSTNIFVGGKSMKIFTHPDDSSIAIIEYGGRRYAMPAGMIRTFVFDDLVYDDQKMGMILGFPGLVDISGKSDVVEAVKKAIDAAKPPPPPSFKKIPPPPPRAGPVAR